MNTEIKSAKKPGSLPKYNISDVEADEGSSANFTFNLESAATRDYSVQWEVSFLDSNSDDVVSLSGTVDIKIGDTSFTILIPTVDDDSFEANEEFNLVIKEVDGVVKDQVVAKGTIINNDPPPVVSFQVSSQTVNESVGVATALVRLDSASGLDVIIPYTISGTTDSNDHNQIDGVLFILAGDIATAFVVSVVDDVDSEVSEDLIVTLSTPTGGTGVLGSNKVHTVTINDNDTQVNIASPLSTDVVVSANETSLLVSGTCSEVGEEVTVTVDDTNGATTVVTPGVQPTCTGGQAFSISLDISSLEDDNITVHVTHSNAGATSTGNDSVTLLKDTIGPSVQIEQSVSESVGTCVFAAQADPTVVTPIEYKVTFDEPINVSSFIVGDITNAGAGGATTLTWTIANCGDDKNFSLKATAVVGNGTIIPNIASGEVEDVNGNANSGSTSTDNLVNYVPNTFLWTGAADPDQNWSTGANWFGGSSPGNSDTATFDGSCTQCNVTIDGNIDIAGLNMEAGYTGAITQGTGNTITVGASGWTQAGGTFTGGNAAIDLNGVFFQSGGVFTSTSNIYSVGFDRAGGIDQTDGFIVSGGAFNHNSGTLQFDFSSNSNGHQQINVAVIDVPSSLNVNNLVINVRDTQGFSYGFQNVVLKISGADELNVAGDLTLLDGDMDGGVINLSGNLFASCTGADVCFGYDSVNGFFNLDSNLESTTKIKIVGNVPQTYTFTGEPRIPHTIINTSSTFSPAGGTTYFGSHKFEMQSGTFNLPAGGKWVVGTKFDINATNSLDGFKYSGGSINATTTNLIFDFYERSTSPRDIFGIDIGSPLIVNDLKLNISDTYSNGDLDDVSVAIQGASHIVINGNAIFEDGILNGSIFEIKGQANFNCSEGSDSAGVCAGGGSTGLVFSGASDQNITLVAGSVFLAGNVDINKASGSIILGNNLSLIDSGQDLNILNGTIDLNSYNLTVNDQLNVGDGVGAASSARIIKGCSTITAGTQNVNPTDGEIVGSSSNPNVTISDATVTEGGNLVFTVSLSEGVCGGDFTVNYTVNDVTATTADSDYSTPATDSDATPNDGVLTLSSGTTSGTITIATTTDTTMELDETLTVVLDTPSHGTLTDDTGVGTIENDDDNGFIWTGDGGDNDFSNGVNWSNGSTAPGAGDVVMFDDTCNDVPANCDVNTSGNISVAGLWIETNYNGVFTQSSGNTIIVGSSN
ncbi:MAG: hypothetical protein KDD58_09955 [Bdellovibrionales bacterium]|nr:hypothetical protein [Bdellovibrionales bacterium]